MKPNLKEEKKLWKAGYKCVVGIDEAGRGPLAGPVTAAAVTIAPAKLKIQKSTTARFQRAGLPSPFARAVAKSQIPKELNEVNDSKKLSAKKREELYEIITRHPEIKWGIGIVSEKIIDKINIKNAAELAMAQALKSLNSKFKTQISKPKLKTKNLIDYLLIDGNHVSNLNLKSQNLKLIVKGDSKVFSIAAASILAKVARDRIMMRYHKKYQKYGFNLHKGYGTELHMKKLKLHGSCKIHRKSFGPVKRLAN